MVVHRLNEIRNILIANGMYTQSVVVIQSSEPLDRKLKTLYNVSVSDTSTI